MRRGAGPSAGAASPCRGGSGVARPPDGRGVASSVCRRARAAAGAAPASAGAVPRGDAVQGAGQLLAQRLGAAAALGGDGRPVAALGALLGQLALLVAEAAAHLLEQLAPGDDAAGARPGVGDLVQPPGGPGVQAALVAAVGLLAAGVVEHL